MVLTEDTVAAMIAINFIVFVCLFINYNFLELSGLKSKINQTFWSKSWIKLG